MKKRILSLLLAAALILALLPQTAPAARAESVPDPLVGPDETVLEEICCGSTRIETMCILYHLCGEPEVGDLSCLDQFEDLDPDVYSDADLRAVAWAVQNGITSRVSANRFGPAQTCTRAQVVTFLWYAMGKPAPTVTEHPFVDVKPGKYYYDAMLWTLSNTDWLDMESTEDHFFPNGTVLYMKLLRCLEPDGTTCFKLRVGRSYTYYPMEGTCGENLFWQYDSETGTLQITGSGEMTSAPWSAFREEMVHVVFPEGMTGVCADAFRSFKGLTEITFPESLTSIGSYAFSGCTGLTAVTLPGSLEAVDKSMFSGCTGLSAVSVLNSNMTISGNYPFGDTQTVTIYGYVPSTAKACAEEYGYAFVSLGYSVLTGVCGKEGENLLWTLYGETGLLEITGSGEMADYDGYSYYADGGYHNRYAPWYDYRELITAVSLPEEMISIGQKAFYRCENLSIIEIPDAVSSIGDSAFSYCTGLTAAELPNGLTSIGSYAFSGCTGLTAVELPDGLTSIGSSAFSYCSGLTSVELPDGLTSIGSSAFSECTGLTSVELPDGLTSIGSYAFSYCTGLTAVSFPETVAAIESGAFCNCSALREIRLPASLRQLGAESVVEDPEWMEMEGYHNACGAFENCTALTSLTIPEGLTAIGVNTFRGCSALRSVRLPNSITDIAYRAFFNCASLIALVVPNPDCVVRQDTLVDDHTPGDTSEDLCYTTTTSAYCLGDPSRTVIYGTHDPEKENAAPIEETFTYQYMDEWDYEYYTETLTLHRRYAENYAKTFAYTFYEIGVFGDVKPGRFYEIPVAWAYAKGVTSGVDATHFGPNQDCTRAQVVTFLWNAMGQPAPTITEHPFTDVKEGKYYYNAVLWAYETGVTSGVDATHFGTSQTCTRGQVVTFLWNAMGQPAPTITEHPFVDVKPGKFYYNAMLWALENGVTAGIDETHFAPSQTCTRGQVVTFLYNTLAP